MRWLEKFGLGMQELEQGGKEESAHSELVNEEELDFGSPHEDVEENHGSQRGLKMIIDEVQLPDCSCLTSGPNYSSSNSRFLGIDTENGSSGEVSISSCAVCGRSWLKFFIEYEAFSRSGRWFLGVIPGALAESITPEMAVGILESLEWYIRGGSYFSGTVSRASGKLSLGMHGSSA